MAVHAPARPGHRRRPAAERPARRRWLRPVALVTGLTLVGGCAGAYLYIRHLDANIQHAPLGAGNAPPPGGAADEHGRTAMNILIIGTDSRKDLGGAYGDRQNVGRGNNDVNIVLHVYPDRRSAVALDLPRDTLIDLPACKDPQSGLTAPAVKHRPLNEAMGRGGPGCVQDTVQSVTNLKIDHFAVVNFQGVKDLTDAVDGVDVTLCRPIKDGDSHLDLPAGRSHLSGEQGLQFVRTRHAVQDGTAVGRFSMQRDFLSSLLRKLTDRGTLLDPTKAFPVIEAAARSITVDDAIAGTTKLVGLASELKNIKPAEVAFAQPPVEYTADDPDRDLRQKDRLAQPAADQLFALIRADKSLTGGPDQAPEPAAGAAAATAPAPGAPVGSAPPAAPPAAPSTVPVTVVNGVGTPGLATSAQKTLTGLGYPAALGRNTPQPVAASTVRYGQADRKGAAEAVARALGLPESAVAAEGGGRSVLVTLGADYRAGAPGAGAGPAPVPTAVPGDASVHTGDETACSGGARFGTFVR
ncbi:LytR family transcriptional regulator [Kitasatospora herbaricolor]|uniref:LCP family protein n=1 Tax=Kitasatospora herbaricolor TaxID=68217 RepID=UPI00174BF372|nr:LCP family protein [Kitasatospora herbaricolor]MDQ0308669.1 LCP family protein required for cell wall assembly [Kitasatospora herbaricolor]GGV46316.1 LytR family transcriptional regulator [Kitasatospora herbaricolor]